MNWRRWMMTRNHGTDPHRHPHLLYAPLPQRLLSLGRAEGRSLNLNRSLSP
jgi:hypothetical protein